jgi:hypothetical protein
MQPISDFLKVYFPSPFYSVDNLNDLKQQEAASQRLDNIYSGQLFQQLGWTLMI